MLSTEVTPIRQTPLPERCLFGEEEKQAVMALFDEAMSGGSKLMGYNGAQEQAYCEEWASFLGGGYADAVNSGTNAVYVALAALELEPGSEVIVPAITDPGGCMPVAVLNLVPVPADTQADYFTINAETIADKITKKTKAIIVAHIAGRPADMPSIMQLANQHGIPVIEDCAQNHGGKINGRYVGTFGTISTFSLMYQKQQATAGQGGMVYTKDEALYWKIRSYADRGKPFGIENPQGNVHASLNCNMDELHACIGRVQLRKLPHLVAYAQKLGTTLAERCVEELQHFRLVTEPAWGDNTFWFLFMKVELDALKIGLEQVIEALKQEGITDCGMYNYVPMRMPWAVERYGACPELPNCTHVAHSHLRLGFNAQYTAQELEDLVLALKKIEGEYAR